MVATGRQLRTGDTTQIMENVISYVKQIIHGKMVVVRQIHRQRLVEPFLVMHKRMGQLRIRRRGMVAIGHQLRVGDTIQIMENVISYVIQIILGIIAAV
jgi:hypothetical protein